MYNTMSDRHLLDQVTTFVNKHLKPSSKEIEKTGIIPEDLIRSFGSCGYLTPMLPVDYGGLSINHTDYALIFEQFAKHSIGMRSLMTVQSALVAQSILRFGSNSQKDSLLKKIASGDLIGCFCLTEPDAGSDARNIKTTWTKRKDKFIINGVKKWISFGDLADVFIVIASNRGKSTAFIIPRCCGVKTKRLEGLMLGHSACLSEVYLDNVVVGGDSILGPIDYGFEYVVASALDHGRFSVALGAVAMSQSSLELMTSYANQRKQFNSKLSDFQLIRGMIADATTKVHAARALCLSAATRREEVCNDAVFHTTIAKHYAATVASEVTGSALQIFGANGFSNNYLVELNFREARALSVIEGSAQMQQEMIASYALSRFSSKEGLQ